MEIWSGPGFGSSDTLARFLKSSIEARRTDAESDIYLKHLLPRIVMLFEQDQEATLSTEPDETAALQKGLEDFERMVCTDYATLSTELSRLFNLMVKDLRIIMEGLEATCWAKVRELVLTCLADSFDGLMCLPLDLWSHQWKGLDLLAFVRSRWGC